MGDAGPARLIGSLFDRLTDLYPRNSREVPQPQGEQVRAHLNSVARDLTDLLNTRRSEADIPEEFGAARKSLLAYGLQDFTTSGVDPETIRLAIERAVRVFEPRLTRVQVSVGDLSFSFHITGILRTDTGLQPVVYDADLQTESRQFQVAVGR